MELLPYKNECTSAYCELKRFGFARRAHQRMLGLRSFERLTPDERIFVAETLQLLRDGLATLPVVERAKVMRRMIEVASAL